MNKKIAIIGAGNMGPAFMQGLINGEAIPVKQILLIDQDTKRLEQLQKKWGIAISTNNKDAAQADTIVIAVKPHVVKVVLTEIAALLHKETLILSVAAAMPLELLELYMGSSEFKLVRLMPNIPVAYGTGIVGWIGNKNINNIDKKRIKELLQALGFVHECKDEKELDAFLILSACGPGYVAYLLHMFEQVAYDYGFSKEASHTLITQLFTGTLVHMTKTNVSVQTLISQVATKGGITQEVLGRWDEEKLYEKIKTPIDKGYKKIGTITKSLKGQ